MIKSPESTTRDLVIFDRIAQEETHQQGSLEIAALLDRSIFPGTQGGPLEHVIAAVLAHSPSPPVA